MGMSGSASFLGAKKSCVLSASFPRVAGEDVGGILGPEEPLFVATRRATSLAGIRNLRLFSRGRGGHLMTCRFFDDRKLSTVLRHLELERVLGFGYLLNGDAHTDLGVAHLGFGGPVPSVAVRRAFRIDSFARAGELMVGVNLLVRVISQERDALRWPHRSCAFRVACDKESARIPFALFRGRELASGHRAERLGLAHDVPRADVIGEPLDLWPWLRRALRCLRLDGYDEKHHANREQHSYSFHNYLRLYRPTADVGVMETHVHGAVLACEDDTSRHQIFNRESFSPRGRVAAP